MAPTWTNESRRDAALLARSGLSLCNGCGGCGLSPRVFLASTCSLTRLALVIYERREKLNKAVCSSCGISEAFPSVNQNITNCLRFCPTSSPKPGYDRKKKKKSLNSHFPGHRASLDSQQSCKKAFDLVMITGQLSSPRPRAPEGVKGLWR